MPTATTSPVAVTSGAGGIGPPPPDRATYRFAIANRADDVELADVSTIFVETAKISKRLSRPTECSIGFPADHALVRTLAADGYPIVSAGRRCLKVWSRDEVSDPWKLIANAPIWFVEDVGGEDVTTTSVTAYDQLILTRFRLARDATGNYAFPRFNVSPSSGLEGPITGPDLIKQLIDNSVFNSGPSFDYEGDIGIDTTWGEIDLVGPDVRGKLADFPKTIDEFLILVTASGQCDIWLEPVDTSMGWPALYKGYLNAVINAGSTTPVHYDYGMGDHSLQEVRRSFDMDTVTNKLRFLLGPKQTHTAGRWSGSIEATNSDLADPPQTFINSQIIASRNAFLTMQDVQIYDDGYKENEVRKVFQRLWQEQMLYRAMPRQMVYATPVRDAPFRASSLKLGDRITINISDSLREPVSGLQRVWGWDVEVDANTTEAITTLVVDPIGGA